MLESALRRARSFGGPVIVHAVTTKGYGYAPAETDQIDAWHATGIFDPDSGAAVRKTGLAWTDAFADELVRIGGERPDVVAVTAAMLHPTGLAPFAERFPERTFDVGIAEQHALTSAAGMAMAGLHPVVAVYSTFLNRAFDQLLMDVALHGQPVTVVLDRAGVTGDDGASHNGMWDMSILSVVPGLRLAAPRDEATLREALREAVAVTDGPTVVRFPKGVLPPDLPALERRGPVDVLRRGERRDVLLVAVGSMVPMCLAVAERAADHGVDVTVVDPRWVLPVSPELAVLASGFRLVVTVEDGGRAGGVGTTLSQVLQDRQCDVPVRTLGLPQRFFDHGSRGQVLADAGLTEQDVARRVVEWAAVLADRADARVTRARGRRPAVTEPTGEWVIAEIQVAPSPPGYPAEPARARRGRDRGDRRLGAALRGGRARHDARGRGRPRLGHAPGRARGDDAGRCPRRALAREDRLGAARHGQPHPQVPLAPRGQSGASAPWPGRAAAVCTASTSPPGMTVRPCTVVRMAARDDREPRGCRRGFTGDRPVARCRPRHAAALPPDRTTARTPRR